MNNKISSNSRQLSQNELKEICFFVLTLILMVITTSCMCALAFVIYNDRLRVHLGRTKINSEVESLRIEDVEWLRKYVTSSRDHLRRDARFVIVRGQRGIGKTTAVRWAFKNRWAVFEISPVTLAISFDEIIKRVVEKITEEELSPKSYHQVNNYLDWYENKATPWFGKVSSIQSFVVIIPTVQLNPGQKLPSTLTSAARVLAQIYGLNVVIDCEETSLSEDSLTGREIIFDMEPMSNEMMRRLPQFATLLTELREQNNEELVLAVCGGAPACLAELQQIFSRYLTTEKRKSSVDGFVHKRLELAALNVANLTRKMPSIQKVLESFRHASEIKYGTYVNDDEVSEFSRVLYVARYSRYGDDAMVVPANGATAVVLRVGLDKIKNIENVRSALVATSSHKSSRVHI